jgi:hypothetical protein
MNGWLLIRLGGIALGIITLLGFASGFLHVEFKPYVRDVLGWLQHLGDYVIQPELIERGLDWLRQHFAWVPKPDAHWRPLYTLLALLMLSMARHLALWHMIPFAVLCSLVPAVIAGTMPVGSLAVALWPFAGFVAFFAIYALLHGDLRVALQFAAVAAALAALAAAAGYFFGAGGEGPWALVGLAGFVGAFGLLFLVLGLLGTEGTFLQRLQVPDAATGLDVTATLGGALFIGYLAAA